MYAVDTVEILSAFGVLYHFKIKVCNVDSLNEGNCKKCVKMCLKIDQLRF